MGGNGERITTREFYAALLEIRPHLQRIDERLRALQEWAVGSNGVESRLRVLERRQVQEDSRSRTLRAIGGVLRAVVYAAIALASAILGTAIG